MTIMTDCFKMTFVPAVFMVVLINLVFKKLIGNTQSMFALLYQFWLYILSPENKWSQVMVASILGETGSSKFIARLVTIQVLLSNFMMHNNCFMITLCLIISCYHNLCFCWRFA